VSANVLLELPLINYFQALHLGRCLVRLMRLLFSVTLRYSERDLPDNALYLGLTKTIHTYVYMVYIYGILSREITIHTYMRSYGVYIRFWPTLVIPVRLLGAS